MGKWQDAANELAQAQRAQLEQVQVARRQRQTLLEAECAKVPGIDAAIQEFVTAMQQVGSPGLENFTSNGMDGFGSCGQTFRAWIIRDEGAILCIKLNGTWTRSTFIWYGANNDDSDLYGTVAQWVTGREAGGLFYRHPAVGLHMLYLDKIRKLLVLKLLEHGAPLPNS